MSLYQRVVMDLKQLDAIKEIYRFQGASSFQHFDFRTSRFNELSGTGYVYFSESLDHHKYFTTRRIRQMLNRIVLVTSPYEISCHDLRTDHSYRAIKDLIINSDKLHDMYSIRLICDRNASELISSNCVYQKEKTTSRAIERVDRRVYGGGYGVADEWKELLTYLTYFNAYQKIDRKSILQLLSNMRTTGRVNNKENINFILGDASSYSIELNPALESDFTKYKIMNCLESIIDQGLYLPGSSLDTEPTQTIKNVVEDYEKRKQKTLRLLKDHSK